MLLGRISPPFLDFIESSGVTTQWMSLTEMLRGTHTWTPFVASTATAAASLVTSTVAVLATALVAAAGLAGLALRSMPARGRLITMLLIGVVLLALGYSGGLGSPIGTAVQEFLDGTGTPLRNLAKLDPVLRLPLALGPGASAGPDSVAGQRASDRCGCRAFSGPSATSGSRWPSWCSPPWPPEPRSPGRGASRLPEHSPRSRSTGTTPRTGSMRTTPSGAGCWSLPAPRSPPRPGATATTNRCRCSDPVRGACAIRFR